MAVRAALYFDGDWDVFVVEGRLWGMPDRRVTKDVLDRPLPNCVSAVRIYSVKHSQRVRIANQVKGCSRQRRQEVYLDWEADARKTPKGSHAPQVPRSQC